MRVTVKHYFLLTISGESKVRQIVLGDNSIVDDLLPILDIKQEEVGGLILNGKVAGWGQQLEENDVITLIPHIGGG